MILFHAHAMLVTHAGAVTWHCTTTGTFLWCIGSDTNGTLIGKIYSLEYTMQYRSRLDRSVELLYKPSYSIPVGWYRQSSNQSCSWGRCNVNTEDSIECCTVGDLSVYITTPLNKTTIHLRTHLQHHPIRMRLYGVQHSYLIYSCQQILYYKGLKTVWSYQ